MWPVRKGDRARISALAIAEARNVAAGLGVMRTKQGFDAEQPEARKKLNQVRIDFAHLESCGAACRKISIPEPEK
mgnify:CR=1 FL=1